MGRGYLRIPDFFIVGALKSGTTALYSYLAAHPSVFMPARKEPGFFCSDFADRQAIRNEAQYRSLFVSGQDRLTGEATPKYLCSEVAIPRIMELRPDARIIAILRNPHLAAPSYHRQRLLSFEEDVEDFATAWRLQPERAGGRAIPALCQEPKLLQYGAIFSYAGQLERLMHFVPEHQRHVIIYEEFFANPLLHYQRLLAFLNLPFEGRSDFPVVNPARRVRSRALARLYGGAPQSLLTLWRPLSRLARGCGIDASALIRAMNSAPGEKLRLNASVKSELSDYFRRDIAATAALLGRDLDIWRMPAGEKQ